jgi:hypothetical protein
MSARTHACEQCGEAVDPTAGNIVLAIEKLWVGGGEPPELRIFVDGRECYFHDHHLPPGAEYLYRLAGNGRATQANSAQASSAQTNSSRT